MKYDKFETEFDRSANQGNQLDSPERCFRDLNIYFFLYKPSNFVLSFPYPYLYTLLCSQSQDGLGWFQRLFHSFFNFACILFRNSWWLGWLFLLHRSKLHSFSWFLSEDDTQNQNIVEPHRYSMTGFDGKNLLLFSDRNRILRIKAISPSGSSEI